MKKFSDYKGEDAIELWADLIEPLNVILNNENVRKVIASGESKMSIAKVVLKECKKEAVEILLRIDPEPIDGLNIIMRLIAVLADIGSNDEIKSFFGFAEAVETENESSGSATENTEDDGK